MLEGHQQNVNGVAFTPDGQSLVSAGYDLTLRIWPLEGGPETTVTLPTPLNSVAVARDGEIVAGGADGRVFFLSAQTASCAASSTAASCRSSASHCRPTARLPRRPASAARSRSSTGGRGRLRARWSAPDCRCGRAAFLPDSRTLVTGGTDRMIRRWNAMTGDHIGSVPMADNNDPLAAFAGDRGAEVFRACIACHTLTPDEGNRAGPTLAGIFGRKIASLPGYNFSPALKQLDIVWTPETVSKLFEIGPMQYTPGTKMPEQTIGSAEDRAALVEFLQKVTGSR